MYYEISVTNVDVTDNRLYKIYIKHLRNYCLSPGCWTEIF